MTKATFPALAQRAPREPLEAITLDMTPDLSAVPGWRPAWGLVSGVNATVFATGYEKPQTLGDGTMRRSASKGVTLTP